jgi:hypothetical protein
MTEREAFLNWAAEYHPEWNHEHDVWAQTAWAAWQARASAPIPAGEPVAWTLTETLTKRETTTRGHLWFTDPVNSLWTPLYTSPPAPPAPKVVPLSEERIAAEFKRIQGDDAESAAFDFFDFRHGVRFAERAHGIEAAFSAAPSGHKDDNGSAAD